MDAFDACIRNGRLRPFEATDEDLIKEMGTSLSEIERARAFLRDGRCEDTVIQAYFGMYRSAKSLLMAGGYRDTNLYSLVAGVTRLYVQPGAIDPKLIDLLKIAKDQKDLVYEGARCGRKDTRLILGAAERLVQRACELLDLPGVSLPDEEAEASPESD